VTGKADSGVDAGWLRSVVERFVAEARENDLGLEADEKVFDAPLVGFAAGDDPLWRRYRDHIGDFYLTPADLFRAAFPDEDPDPRELTVVSWILPSTAATRREQARETRHPSVRWARTRHQGELFNTALRGHVVAQLARLGVPAVAPLLSPAWHRADEGPWAPCSNWSERHAAHAAGLGTFGLCDGLITPVGKAHRTGSVVARVAVAATPRPYRDHHAYCLHYTHGSCGKCIPRCPVGALSERGHDKRLCMAYTERTMNRFLKEAYGIDNYACGLCQCGVPCTDHVPTPEEG